MARLDASILLGPADEAARLWSGAREAFGTAHESLVSLCECLSLGVRAAEILIVQRLAPARSRFAGTIAMELETPSPDLDTRRDAVDLPRTVQFTELLDLLSDGTLDCVGPRLHRGWEDRRFSCARARETARTAVGVTLDRAAREKLLLLSAYRNRVFRYPPPIRVVPAEILDAFGELERLVARLQ